MSFDGVNSPEPLAITAAGAALLISGAPGLLLCVSNLFLDPRPCCLRHALALQLLLVYATAFHPHALLLAQF